MSVTLQAVGNNLDVSIIDDNFTTIQDLFRSGLLKEDFASLFDRYRIRRYTSGRIIAAHSGAFPYRQKDNANTKGTNGTFDITYRRGTEDSGDIAAVRARIEGGPRNAYAMELLGRPGPSFYFTWQEESEAEPTGATGWPPGYWPVNRYPESLCFSRWLTAPDASVRVFVPFPCVARIHGTIKGSLTAFQSITTDPWILPPGLTDRQRNVMIRAGLIVDTNPNIFDDEFVNTNPNLLDSNGDPADYKSWEVVKEKTFYCAQRELIKLWAEVALKGNRFYNFSFKFRDAAHHGWVNEDTNTWDEGIWEKTLSATNSPNVHSLYATTGVQDMLNPPWINLWENNSLNVELFYGRDTAYTTDKDSAEFSLKPTFP